MIAQCPPQRKANYQSLAKRNRPPEPQPPSIPVPGKHAKQSEVNEWNEVAYKIFRDHMAMCFQCGRKFSPDRLPVHMRGCHATGHFSYDDIKNDSGSSQSSQQASKHLPVGKCNLCNHSCYQCKKNNKKARSREVDFEEEAAEPVPAFNGDFSKLHF